MVLHEELDECVDDQNPSRKSLVFKQELAKDLTSSSSQGQAQVQPARDPVLRKPDSEKKRPE